MSAYSEKPVRRVSRKRADELFAKLWRSLERRFGKNYVRQFREVAQ
jgi:hypothetical protein